MKTPIEIYKQAILSIDSINDINHLVQIFDLILCKLDISSIQEMANKEGKSYNGILNSNRYKKIKIGKKTTLAIKGLRNDKDQLPF